MDTVGVIGLGLMGSALCERFLGGGRRVIGFDVRPEAPEKLAAMGGEAVPSASEVFAASSLVVLSLPNSDIVAATVESVRSSLTPQHIIIDTTTGDPDATAALGARLAAVSVGYLDATLTGSSEHARAGQVVVTAGGDAKLFERCEPLFRLFAKQWFHVGPCGSGARTKLVVNLVLGLNRAVLAEGLMFAKASGLHLPAILDILRSGVAYSRVMDTKGRKMIDGDFATEAKLSQHLKDVRLILDAGAKSGAALPLSHLHETLLASVAERGFADADNSSVIRAFDPE